MVFSTGHLCLCVSVHLAARSRDFSFTRAVLGSRLSRDGGGSTWPPPTPGRKGRRSRWACRVWRRSPRKGAPSAPRGRGKRKTRGVSWTRGLNTWAGDGGSTGTPLPRCGRDRPVAAAHQNSCELSHYTNTSRCPLSPPPRRGKTNGGGPAGSPQEGPAVVRGLGTLKVTSGS